MRGSPWSWARGIKRLLKSSGLDPEEILVLFRRWDDDADLTLKTLQAWGLPAAADRREGSRPPLPSRRLRLAMAIPIEHWETASLIRWLRHGQVRPPWLDRYGPLALSKTASAIRGTRVFRGLDPIRRALDRAQHRGTYPREERSAQRRGGATSSTSSPRSLEPSINPVLGIISATAFATSPGRSGLARGVIPSSKHSGMRLDDHGAVLERLGYANRIWTWAEFTREIEAADRRVERPPCPLPRRLDPPGRGG